MRRWCLRYCDRPGPSSSWPIDPPRSPTCLGGGAAVGETALLYVVGSALSNAAPTPGAIGATEAALTAGLTAAGMASHVALAAVLMFRVATFWLPLLPGWLTFPGLPRAADI